MSRIVLISCVSKKLEEKAKAKDLYISTLFECSLLYANSLKPDKIFILSAHYLLVHLEQEIEPYNVTLSIVSNKKRTPDLKVLTTKEKNDWGKKILDQLETESNLETDEFIFLAGEEYIKPIEQLNRIKIFIKPLTGMKLGERISYMQNNS
jgi:hypothetical protein